MDFRGLVKHTFIYASGIWAGKAIAFLMIPIYTRCLTPVDYGILEMIGRTTDIIALVTCMGMASALLRFHAEAKSDMERRRVVSTAITFAAGLGVLCAALLLMFAAPLSQLILGSARYSTYFRLGFVAMGMEVCVAVPMVLLRMHERSALFTGINLGRLLVALSLNIYMLVVLRMGVMGVMISTVVGISLVVLVLMGACWRSWRPGLDTRLLRVMLAYSLPLVPCSFVMFVLTFGDRYFLRAYCGLGVLGVYSLGHRICMVMPALVMEPLGFAWTPVVFTLADRPDAGALYARYFNGFMFCVVFACLWLSALSRDLIRIMADSGYHDAYKVVPVVTLGMTFWAASSVFETGIMLKKKTYYRTMGHALAALIVVCAYVLLIPRYGAMGAAWATVCGFAAMAASIYLLSRRLYYIPYDLRRFALLLTVAFFVYACCMAVPGAGSTNTVLLRTLLVIAFPALLCLTGYFTPENAAAAKGLAISLRDRIFQPCRKSAS